LSTLIMVAISFGNNQYAKNVSAQCEAYAREVDDKILLGRALSMRCIGQLVVGDIEGIETWSREALQSAQASGDTISLGLSLGVTCQYLMLTGKDPELARSYASQSVQILKENGQIWAYSLVLLGIGMAAKFKGDFKLSRENFSVVLPLFREMGDNQRANMILSEYGHMERYEGNFEKAEQIYRETIPVWHKIGHRAAVANQLEVLAFIAIAHEQGERAARLLGAAEALREKVQIPMSQFERLEYAQHVAALRGSMDEQALSDLWSQGRAMRMEQAVQLALESA